MSDLRRYIGALAGVGTDERNRQRLAADLDDRLGDGRMVAGPADCVIALAAKER